MISGISLAVGLGTRTWDPYAYILPYSTYRIPSAIYSCLCGLLGPYKHLMASVRGLVHSLVETSGNLGEVRAGDVAKAQKQRRS